MKSRVVATAAMSMKKRSHALEKNSQEQEEHQEESGEHKPHDRILSGIKTPKYPLKMVGH